MPGGDITHPVPDLTGYSAEGQIVLSPEVAAHGVYPPIDALASLSRLMRSGAGPGKTREDHPTLAAQLLAALARARQVRVLADLVGEAALADTDRRYLAFDEQFRSVLLDQGRSDLRSLTDSLERAWRAVLALPRQELTMLPDELLRSRE